MLLAAVSETDLLQDLAVLMVVAGLVAAVFSRFGWPKVLGYILGGLLMSEHTWGGSFLSDARSVQITGQLGVVFLMLALGLSFSAKDMARIRFVALPAAVLDTVVMIWWGYMVGTRLFGWSPAASFFFGVAICDSATTLLAKVLDEKGWANRPFAKYVMGTSVCEDIVCVGAISVATGFASGGSVSAFALFKSLGGLAVFFLTVLVFGFVLVPRLLESVAKRHDDEALVLTLLGCCFFVTYLAYSFEFSVALGAFLVGIIGASSAVRDRLGRLVSSLKSMYAAVFFVSIGLLVDPAAQMRFLPQILIVSAIVVAGKFVNVTLASLLSGLDVKTAVQNGMGLAQIGEFAFMVAILASSFFGGEGREMFQIAIGASLLTTILNPFLIRVSDRAGDFAERHVPRRMAVLLESYRVWVEKIRASRGNPAYRPLKATAVRLGVYAVLLLSGYIVFAMLPRFDFSPFSEFLERNDKVVFFLLVNVFAVSMLPLVVAASRTLGDEISALLLGEGDARWQTATRQLVRYVARTAVVALFFAEWAMLNAAAAPSEGLTSWITLAVVVATGVVGWRFFVKMGRRATGRLKDSLTAEERRESLERTMTITLPEGTVHRLSIGRNSPAVGGTVVSLNIRAKTGASVVSVMRDGRVYRNIGPEWEFRIGDTLGVLGDGAQIAALKDLLGVVD